MIEMENAPGIYTMKVVVVTFIRSRELLGNDNPDVKYTLARIRGLKLARWVQITFDGLL